MTLDTMKPGLDDRMFEAALGVGDLALFYIGERLGLYRTIRDRGAVTAADLASASATDERSCREWLEANAASGLLGVDDAAAAPAARRFSLLPGSEAMLADPDDAAFLGFLPRVVLGAVMSLPAILDSFRTGAGVSWSQFGPDVIEGQEAQNKILFLQRLATEWLPSIPDVHAALSAPGARVADIACGAGWSSIAIAEGYPAAEVSGLDLDEYSIDLARRNAAARGLSDRVRFEVRDASDPLLAGAFDLVTIFEALHDMGDPVAALRAARGLAGDRGAVVIVDEKTEDAFTPNAGPLERLFYAYSVLCCLPAALADGPVGTGTLMRPETLRAYAAGAGFSGVEILDIESEMFRFYRLR